MMGRITEGGEDAGVQIAPTDITKSTGQEKNISGTFRHEKDDIQPGVSRLSPISVPVLGGQVREAKPGQTRTGDVRIPEHDGGTGMIAHCNVCSRAGFRPVIDAEWEDPRYIAIRALANIKIQDMLKDDCEKAILGSAIKMLSQSVFRGECARRLAEEQAAAL
jgi:hypothetical protein